MFQRKADEGDEVGKPSGLRATLDLSRPGRSKGVPEAVLGPGGVVFAELFLQFIEHRLGEALFVRAAIKNLQRGDLGFVLLDIFAKGSQEGGGPFFRGSVEVLLRDGINSDGV